MSRWSRDEIEEAFARYQEVARRAGRSGGWRERADQFTEDATYAGDQLQPLVAPQSEHT